MAERDYGIVPQIDDDPPETADETAKIIYDVEDPVSAQEALSTTIMLAGHLDAVALPYNIVDSDRYSRGIKVYFIGDKWQTPQDEMTDSGKVAPNPIH